MKPSPGISTAEWKVMNILWDRGIATFPQIRQALSESAWSDKTIATLLFRLVKKGAVRKQGTRKEYTYLPAVTIEEARNKEFEKFLEKVHAGSLASLIISCA
ncbi:MAG TPA: hypothetical protein DD727_08030, partial [Clostridiales bacterium]|nr:hypothetical protein [Clostridiales bacterium]